MELGIILVVVCSLIIIGVLISSRIDKKQDEEEKLKQDALTLIKTLDLISDSEPKVQKEVPPPIPQEVQDIVLNRDGGKCVLCGSKQKLEFDYIVPVSKGGSNTADNLQTLCIVCSVLKSNNIKV